MVESGAEIVVTLDADGQHCPREMERLVKPVLEGQADLVNGSRVLGYATAATSPARGHRLLQLARPLMTRTITDCSNGYRAVRTSALQLDLRQ